MGYKLIYPLVNEVVDSENNSFLVDTHLPTPTHARVELWTFTEGYDKKKGSEVYWIIYIRYLLPISWKITLPILERCTPKRCFSKIVVQWNMFLFTWNMFFLYFPTSWWCFLGPKNAQIQDVWVFSAILNLRGPTLWHLWGGAMQTSSIPSGKLTVCYRQWLFIVDLAMKHGTYRLYPLVI